VNDRVCAWVGGVNGMHRKVRFGMYMGPREGVLEDTYHTWGAPVASHSTHTNLPKSSYSTMNRCTGAITLTAERSDVPSSPETKPK